MSINLQEDLWVTVQEFEGPNAPHPLPLTNGFSSTKAYKVLGLHSPSETSEAYFILCNDRNEIWFISNRHFRAHEGEQYSRPSTVPRNKQTPANHFASNGNGKA